MKIEKVTYQKTYSIGPYLTDRVGFEATPSAPYMTEEGKLELDMADEILTNLEKMADEWHRKAHPHLYQGDWNHGSDFPDHMKTEITFGPLPIINSENKELGPLATMDGIKNAQSLEELKSFKLLINNDKQLYDAYCSKLKELTQ